MDLVIATNNAHKLAEIARILEGLPFNLLPLSRFADVPELKEEGETYAENARHKARTIARFTGRWSLADDTGLEVDALDGAPGLYSARYAGEDVTFEANRRKLLEALRDVPGKRRTAAFLCVIALAGPSGEDAVFEGEVRGRITEEDQGSGGFGYDPVFLVEETGKTFSEMSPEEKNRISHRARALEKARDYLDRLADAKEAAAGGSN